MRYVDDATASLALAFEQRFARLPETAGVLFVSVQAQPSESGRSKEFFIRLGIRRDLEESVGKALVEHVLEQEIQSGVKVYVGVYRGVSGTCRSSGAATAHPSEA